MSEVQNTSNTQSFKNFKLDLQTTKAPIKLLANNHEQADHSQP